MSVRGLKVVGVGGLKGVKSGGLGNSCPSFDVGTTAAKVVDP